MIRDREKIEINNTQFRFMPGRGTTDPMFILRQKQEKALEGSENLHMAFVDLEKAYNRISREIVFWCLREKGVSEKMVRAIATLYKTCITKVVCAAEEAEYFDIQIGLHQGSALSTFLFAAVVDTVANNVKRGLLEEAVYADDLVITVKSQEEVQQRLHD